MAHGLRLTSIPATHHAEKHRQYLRDPLAVVGEAVTNLVRKAEYPLAHGHPGQHLVDQARRRIGHASAAAGRAEPSLLAGKGNRPARPAVLTTGPHEPVGQNPAFEVGPHLLLDVERQLVLGRSGLLEKGFQMPGEDLVEGLLFRFAGRYAGVRISAVAGMVPVQQQWPDHPCSRPSLLSATGASCGLVTVSRRAGGQSTPP